MQNGRIPGSASAGDAAADEHTRVLGVAIFPVCSSHRGIGGKINNDFYKKNTQGSKILLNNSRVASVPKRIQYIVAKQKIPFGQRRHGHESSQS